jgi:hypothetical protein
MTSVEKPPTWNLLLSLFQRIDASKEVDRPAAQRRQERLPGLRFPDEDYYTFKIDLVGSGN